MTRLRALASEHGVLSVLALDHRDAFRNAFVRAGITNVDETMMLETKARIASALAADASAIMLDPLAAETIRPDGIGIILPLEEQGHVACAGGRLNRLQNDFEPARAAGLGANACKLLLHYRSDHAATFVQQQELVASAAEACHHVNLPLVLEPLVYRLDNEDEKQYAGRFAELVDAAAQDFSRSEADLLKLQFPAGAESDSSCAQLTRSAGEKPWALLGGGDADGTAFAEQLEIACRAGAAGFLAGRTLWCGGLGLSPQEQTSWLERDARLLFQRLSAIAENYASPLSDSDIAWRD